MQKITLQTYFSISDLLDMKSRDDFKIYKDELFYKDNNYEKGSDIEELLKFHSSEEVRNKSEVFEYLKLFKTFILYIGFIVAVLLTAYNFDENINIKTYAIFSIVVPLIWMIVSAYRLFSYKFPSKYEKSIFNTLFLKSIKIDEKYSHVIKTYSMQSWLEVAISYTVGVLLSTVFIFWAYSINFYSQTTYGSMESLSTNVEITKQIKDSSLENMHSKAYYSYLITGVIVILIFFKFILMLKAKRNLHVTMLTSLKEQAQEFFDVMNTSVEIKSNHNDFDSNKMQAGANTSLNNIESLTNLKEYYVLYYNMELSQKEQVVFDFSKDIELADKSSDSYSFAIFNKEDEDKKVITKIGNLVMIFTSVQSLPDNTFKDDIKQILSNENVKQIWVLPLVEVSSSLYELSQKSDDNYVEFKKQIENMQNLKVRLYSEK